MFHHDKENYKIINVTDINFSSGFLSFVLTTEMLDGDTIALYISMYAYSEEEIKEKFERIKQL